MRGGPPFCGRAERKMARARWASASIRCTPGDEKQTKNRTKNRNSLIRLHFFSQRTERPIRLQARFNAPSPYLDAPAFSPPSEALARRVTKSTSPKAEQHGCTSPVPRHPPPFRRSRSARADFSARRQPESNSPFASAPPASAADRQSALDRTVCINQININQQNHKRD